MGARRKRVYHFTPNKSPDMGPEEILMILLLMNDFNNHPQTFIKCQTCGHDHPRALISLEQRPYPEYPICRVCKTAINLEIHAREVLTNS